MESNVRFDVVELKLQLKFVKKQKFLMEKKLNGMRSKVNKLTEEIGNLNTENEFIVSQISDMSNEISKLKCQMAIIGVCKESENSKRKVELTNMDKHKIGYDVQFDKEKAVTAIQKEKLQQKEEEKREVEKQNVAKLLEQNEHRSKLAAVIEQECDGIERESSILMNRNKAVMCKLRRKLLETEKKRRVLIKRNNLHH